MSYSPKTGLPYVPATDKPATCSSGDFIAARGDRLGYGPDDEIPPDVGKRLAWAPSSERHAGALSTRYPFNVGFLLTAGNFVFRGTATGEFSAYNDASGETL